MATGPTSYLPEVVSRQIVPTLLATERRSYRLGSDAHFKYYYLAQRLVSGTARTNLEEKKLSQMYSVFESHHGPREALALMIFLFRSCDDSLSADKLEALARADSGPCDSGQRPESLLFSGTRVSEEDRTKFNFRKLVVRIAEELDNSKQEDLITILEAQTGDSDSKDTKFKTILVQMTKACHAGVLTAQSPSVTLLEWLNQLGFTDDGDPASMRTAVTKFDPKKQFPGKVVRQTSTDSAYEEGCDEQTSTPGPQNLPSAGTSVESYSRDSSLFSRGRSIEESSPQTSSSEMVATKK